MLTLSSPTKTKLNYTPILSEDRVIRHAEAVGSSRIADLVMFCHVVFGELKNRGLNPDIILGMSNLETDHWRSVPWVERLNPGGIGITGAGDQLISFPDGTAAARAFGVHYMAYVKGHDNYFANYIALDPRYVRVHMAGFAGIVKTLGDFGNGRWATDPLYATKVIARVEEMAT